MTDFFRFPHTPHLAWLGPGAPRDDKVLAPAEAQVLLAKEVVVEEKLDGANLGLSLAPDGRLRAQNRGQYLYEPHVGQFARLPAWLAQHEAGLREALTPDLILFGEWVALIQFRDLTYSRSEITYTRPHGISCGCEVAYTFWICCNWGYTLMCTKNNGIVAIIRRRIRG